MGLTHMFQDCGQPNCKFDGHFVPFSVPVLDMAAEICLIYYYTFISGNNLGLFLAFRNMLLSISIFYGV